MFKLGLLHRLCHVIIVLISISIPIFYHSLISILITRHYHCNAKCNLINMTHCTAVCNEKLHIATCVAACVSVDCVLIDIQTEFNGYVGWVSQTEIIMRTVSKFIPCNLKPAGCISWISKYII